MRACPSGAGEEHNFMAKVRDMTQGRPARLILSFALPLMLGNMFQQMYVMVDTMVVGKFVGVDALASLGAADWLNWLVIGLVQGLTQGFSIQISQRFGAEDWDGLNRAITGTILLSGAVGAVLTAAALLLAEPVLLLLRTPADILPGSLDYLHVMFSGTLALMGYNAFASILRAMGNSRTPLIAMVIASVLNVGLDLLFVLVFHWGIAGAAGATVLAQVVSCLICLWAMRGLPIPRIEKSQWRLSAPLMRRLFSLGAPLALQNTIIAVGGMAVQSVVNGFGVLFVAGYTATNKLYGLLEIAATSFGFSMATYTGQNLGAKQYRRIDQVLVRCMVIVILIGLTLGNGAHLLGQTLLGIYSSDAEVISYGMVRLGVVSVSYFLCGMMDVVAGSVRGMGYSILPMLVSLAGACVFRIIWIFTVFQWQHTLFSLYISYPISWALTICAHLVCYFVVRRRVFPKREAQSA